MSGSSIVSFQKALNGNGASVDMKTVGDTTIFTCPANKILVPRRLIIVAEDFDQGAGNQGNFNVGKTAPDYNDYLLDSQLFINETDKFTHVDLSFPADPEILTSGESLVVRISNASTFVTQQARFFAFGFLYDAPPAP